MAEQNLLPEVYIVDGARTPFLKVRDQPNPFSASDLAVAVGKTLLSRQPFPIAAIDEVILGSVMPRESEANIARIVGLRLECGVNVPAWTVQRNCASGMQALDAALKDIITGRYELILAGGTEAMSHAPLLYNKNYVKWLAQLSRAKTSSQKLAVLTKIKPSYFKPEIALRIGLSDPVVGLSMGQTAENLAYEFQISREAMDQYAYQSHQKVAAAKAAGYLNEITPIYDSQGNFYDSDTGVRADTTLTKLAQLKPIFDQFGSITAGNSSQVTDGAVLLLLASKNAVKRFKLPILGKIVDCQWAALDPARMGLGPIYAATPLLKRQKLQIQDIDFWEINEAFAAQVLACIKAWDDSNFCQQELGLTTKMGQLPLDKLNVDGGAIALGHPVGASGARIVLHLLELLKRKQARRALAMVCIGGGQGGAMLLERVTDVNDID